jgi:hypothetical protein
MPLMPGGRSQAILLPNVHQASIFLNGEDGLDVFGLEYASVIDEDIQTGVLGLCCREQAGVIRSLRHITLHCDGPAVCTDDFPDHLLRSFSAASRS